MTNSVLRLISSTVLLFFIVISHAQNKTNASPNKSIQLIEKYYWKGACGTNEFKQLTLEIYNDSSFVLKPLECEDKSKRVLYKSKKEWRESRSWSAYGTWKIQEGKRKYFQENNEMPLKQNNSFITFKDSIILNQIN